MPASVQQFVRYWGFLLSKFVLAGTAMGLIVWMVDSLWAGPVKPKHIGYDTAYMGYLVCLGVAYLIGVGLFYLSILDQRYRCRVCLRRLRMPVETGSWSKMLQFGRPRMEYICVYGHGTLNIPELHLTGTDITEWTEHADYWAELCARDDSASKHR
jgi:hypothetical protein